METNKFSLPRPEKAPRLDSLSLAAAKSVMHSKYDEY